MSDTGEIQHLSDIVFEQIEDSPQQARSKARFRAVLEATEQLLAEGGPEACSIPEVAKRSAVPRSAIYRYFPDRPALLAAMAAASMEQIGVVIRAAVEATAVKSPDGLLATAVGATIGYLNENLVAAILQFNGPFGRIDRETHHAKSLMLVAVLQPHMGPDLSEEQLALTIEIVFACLRYGYFRDGRISAGIEAESLRAARSYLGTQ